MRYALLVPGIAVCIGLHQGWLPHACEGASAAALSGDARLAIELRCDGLDGRAAAECRGLHQKLYLAGALDPEKTLRTHCTPDQMLRWGARPPDPPAACVRHYGGWQKG